MTTPNRYYQIVSPAPIYADRSFVLGFEDFSAFFTDDAIAKVQANEGDAFPILHSLVKDLDNPDRVREVLISTLYDVFVPHHHRTVSRPTYFEFHPSRLYSEYINGRHYITSGILESDKPDDDLHKVVGILREADVLGLFHRPLETVLMTPSKDSKVSDHYMERFPSVDLVFSSPSVTVLCGNTEFLATMNMGGSLRSLYRVVTEKDGSFRHVPIHDTAVLESVADIAKNHLRDIRLNNSQGDKQ